MQPSTPEAAARLTVSIILLVGADIADMRKGEGYDLARIGGSVRIS